MQLLIPRIADIDQKKTESTHWLQEANIYSWELVIAKTLMPRMLSNGAQCPGG